MPKVSKKSEVPSAVEITRLVDRLGELKAIVADANKEVDEIKKKLQIAEVTEASGKLFDVKFTTVSTNRINWNRLQEAYDLPVDKYTEVSESVRMNVTARN